MHVACVTPPPQPQLIVVCPAPPLPLFPPRCRCPSHPEKVIRKDNREKVKAVKEGDSVKGSGGDAGIEDEINKMNVTQLKLALKCYGLTIDGRLLSSF